MGAGNHAPQRACVVPAFTGTDLTDSLAKLPAEVALPADGSDRDPGISIKKDPDGDRLNRCPKMVAVNVQPATSASTDAKGRAHNPGRHHHLYANRATPPNRPFCAIS